MAVAQVARRTARQLPLSDFLRELKLQIEVRAPVGAGELLEQTVQSNAGPCHRSSVPY